MLFFFSSFGFFSLCKYEYGKKCQDVLGGGRAVDIREVADYFLEVHCLMNVCMCVCVCFAYAKDKTGDLMCLCVAEIISAIQISHIQHNNTTTRTHFTVQLLFLPPASRPHCGLDSTKKKLGRLQMS